MMYIYASVIQKKKRSPLRVSIIGGSGYSGTELLRILSGRTDVTISQIIARTSVGAAVADLYPEFVGAIPHRYEAIEQFEPDEADVVFIALPPGEAMEVIPNYIGNGTRIIDLGGDLRLKSTQLYEEYYGRPHTHPELLQKSVYGLPEIYRESILSASIIANPGCYPTSVILPLYPLLREGVIEPGDIVINSLSGVSGAGRKGSVEYSFSEVNENVRAYRVTGHQHIPEIASVLKEQSGQDISFSFVPHLIPITRGIYTTIHAKLSATIDDSGITGLYNEYYGNEPFVRTVGSVPQVKNVVNTNYCDIYATVQKATGHIIVISVIDNLLKGAAGQAVQNMNLLFSKPETYGLV
jgi:N-acetyl-gamma-glutamyl-phosphate reductase